MCNYKGKEYLSDTGRIINKFDIYFCDLGEPETNITGGNLGKKRPCVILSSDYINCPKSGSYLIAPIRTEHKEEVTKETLQTIVKNKKELGRIYIPIEMNPGDFRFIDMTQTQPIPSTYIMGYVSSILNENVKNKINMELINLFFSKEEQNSIIKVNGVEASVSNNLIKFNDKKPKKNPKIKIPTGFSLYYKQYEEGKMTAQQIADKLNIKKNTVYNYVYHYRKLQDASLLKEKEVATF